MVHCFSGSASRGAYLEEKKEGYLGNLMRGAGMGLWLLLLLWLQKIAHLSSGVCPGQKGRGINIWLSRLDPERK